MDEDDLSRLKAAQQSAEATSSASRRTSRSPRSSPALDEARRRRRRHRQRLDLAKAGLDSAKASVSWAKAQLETRSARRSRASRASRSAKSPRTRRSRASGRDRDAGPAKATLDKTEVRAPFDGIVVLKDAEVGEVVSPNVQSGSNARGSVTMVDFASLEVEAEVPETSLSAVVIGRPATIYLDAFSDVPYARASRASGRPRTVRRRPSRCASSSCAATRSSGRDGRARRVRGRGSTRASRVGRGAGEARAPRAERGDREVRRGRVSSSSSATACASRRSSSARRATAAGSSRTGSRTVTGSSSARRRRSRAGTGFARNQAAEDPSMANPIVTVRHVTKSYTRGGETLRVLDGLNLQIEAGRVRRADGPLGLGQDDAPEPDRRPRPARPRARSTSAGKTIVAMSRGASSRAGARARRLHLPALQPDPGAHGARERRAAAAR